MRPIFNSFTGGFDYIISKLTDIPNSVWNAQQFQNLLQNGNFEFWYAGTSSAPTGWTAAGDAGWSIVRSATKKVGNYSVALTSGTVTAYLYVLNHPDIPNWPGKTLSFGMWVKASGASQARISIFDDVNGWTYSSYHSGSNNWEFLTVTKTIDSGATNVIPRAWISSVSAATVYFDGAILVEGSVVPAFMEHPFDKVLNEPRFKVGYFTRDISLASGTQAVTGVGHKPSAVIFLAVVDGTAKASWGLDDGSSARAITDSNGVTADTYADTGVGTSILLYQAAATYSWAVILTKDSDGFTLNWTKMGLPTGTAVIMYLSFR